MNVGMSNGMSKRVGGLISVLFLLVLSLKVVTRLGIEPRTYGLRVRCSAS